jgi:hypothetical protein
VSVSPACRRRAGRVNNHSPPVPDFELPCGPRLEPASTLGRFRAPSAPASVSSGFRQLRLPSAPASVSSVRPLPPVFTAAHAAGSTVSAPRASRPRTHSGRAGGAADTTSVRHPRSSAASAPATSTPPPALVSAPAASAPQSRTVAATRPRHPHRHPHTEGEGPSTSPRHFLRSARVGWPAEKSFETRARARGCHRFDTQAGRSMANRQKADFRGLSGKDGLRISELRPSGACRGVHRAGT